MAPHHARSRARRIQKNAIKGLPLAEILRLAAIVDHDSCRELQSGEIFGVTLRARAPAREFRPDPVSPDMLLRRVVAGLPAKPWADVGSTPKGRTPIRADRPGATRRSTTVDGGNGRIR